MKVKTKKIQCVLLAVMMVFVCATSSFAATYNGGNGDIVPTVTEEELSEFTFMSEEEGKLIKCNNCPAYLEVSCGGFATTNPTGVCTDIVSNCQVWTRLHYRVSTPEKCDNCGTKYSQTSTHSHEAVHTACGRGTLLICDYQ